jgi:Spermine/spermidine synthase domain
MSTRPPYISIMLLSAGALAYEILLMRLFSIIQWHHFAYMIIGLALLGYGISGTLISITQHLLLPIYRSVFIASVLLFSVSATGCFFAAQTIPFNAEAILWDGRQTLHLLLIFLLLTLPFFFAASAICLTFRHFAGQVARIYAMDLIGAGVGSLGIVLLLFHVFPQQALIVIGLLGLAAALIAGRELRVEKWLWIRLGISLVLLMMFIAGQSLQLNLSPYKSLVQALRISGTRIVEERSSPLGLLSVVESKDIPLRHAPGLSLNATREPPPQLGVFTDGDNMTVITRFPESVEQLAYLDQTTSALPYHLKKPKRVLILGAGGGADILQAKYHDVSQIDAVELNPQLVDMVKGNYNRFAGGLYHQKGVTIHIDEARGFLTKSAKRYDLIQLALVDAFNASASGLYALNESYLYTVEALQLYLGHVEHGGFLALTRWIKMPPRDTLKLFATAAEALRQSDIQSPESRLALIRSWQTSTLLIKNGVFQTEEIRAIQRFCDVRSFDIAYTPTITPDQVNRNNILKQPIFYLGAISLLGDKHETFFDRYKFNLRPASDDRPYFHHFFKWSTLPEILQLRGKGGMPLIEWGYMVLLATLAIAVMLSLVLILLPLWFFRRSQEKPAKNVKRTHVVCYFFAIGLAFLFVEIAFIQKFILFLHHPIYAIATTLSAFLVFAGLGSNGSKRLSQQRSTGQVVRLAISAIAVLCAVYIFALPPLFASLVGLPVSIKIFLTILLIAPLAFFMGMPFPMALTSLAEHADQLIPWAWGINGCASVVSAVLATLLAIHFGFTTVILCAVGLYAGSVLVFPGTMKKPF